MCDSGGHLRRFALTFAVVMCTQASVSVMAETTDERIQRLENEIEELRQLLNEQEQPQATPAPSSRVAPATTQKIDVASLRNGAFIRYYISKEPFGEQPPKERKPIVQGRFLESDKLSFNPSTYDVPGSGLFSHYRDPSSYPNVGLQVEGELSVQYAGEYELILSPKPVREGGTNVKTRMSAWLQVDNSSVVQFRDQSSWQTHRGRVYLEPGIHHIQVWAVAASDGFGPSPTESQLLMSLKVPGEVSPRPLRDLQTMEK